MSMTRILPVARIASVTVACVLLIQPALAQPSLTESQENDVIRHSMQTYVNEVGSRRTQGLGLDREFYEKWSAELEKVRASTKTPTATRVRLLGELAAIHMSLGNAEHAYSTFAEQENNCQAINDSMGQSIAINGQIMSARRLEDKERVIRFETLDQHIDKVVKGIDKAEATKLFADTTELLGQTYIREARLIGTAKKHDQEAMYIKASKLYRLSLALDSTDMEKRFYRKYHLAQALYGGGQRDEAGRIYQTLAEVEQNKVSRMMLAYYAAQASFGAGTKEYVEALEKAANELPEDDYLLTLKQNLGFAYVKVGRIDDSIRIFQWLVGKDKDDDVNASNLAYLAELYAAKGDTATSRALLNDVLTRYPHSGSVSYAQRLLRMPLIDLQQLAERALLESTDEAMRHVDNIAITASVETEGNNIAPLATQYPPGLPAMPAQNMFRHWTAVICALAVGVVLCGALVILITRSRRVAKNGRE